MNVNIHRCILNLVCSVFCIGSVFISTVHMVIFVCRLCIYIHWVVTPLITRETTLHSVYSILCGKPVFPA